MSRVPKIEAFVLDLFGVVVSFDNELVYRRLAEHCAKPDEAFERLDGLMAARDVITGKLSLPEIHAQLVATYGLALDFPEFEQKWLEPYHQAMPGMAELLKALSAHYRLVLLSNVDQYYWKVVQALQPELASFDSLILSCDLGLAKPDAEIFEHAARAAGAATTGNCYFVDDTRINTDAAAALGFQTHRFSDVATLRRALLASGVQGA
jgi:HAD superfamily hydrolase (TIGR01509 family)